MNIGRNLGINPPSSIFIRYWNFLMLGYAEFQGEYDGIIFFHKIGPENYVKLTQR